MSMLKVFYGEQRSFPEYVDMYFKEIYLVEHCQYPVRSGSELADLILDGYWIDSPVDIPDDIERLIENEGIVSKDHSTASKTRLIDWCRKFFKQHGIPSHSGLRWQSRKKVIA